jgi:hypothetical protein
MTQPQRKPQPPAIPDDGDWPVDPGRPLGLRLLALLGAFSFVMLGLSSLAPLLQPPQREPAIRPSERVGQAAGSGDDHRDPQGLARGAHLV